MATTRRPLLMEDRPPRQADRHDNPNLPELSDATGRKLALKWSILIDEYRLTGERRDRQTTDYIDKQNSLIVAKARLQHFIDEYWRLWLASGEKSDVFSGWLVEMQRRVSMEIASVFADQPPLDLWYKQVLKPKVDKLLTAELKAATNRARKQEINHLEAVSQGHTDDFSFTDVSSGARSKRTELRAQPAPEARPRTGRPQNISVDGSKLQQFRRSFELGKRTQTCFASRVLNCTLSVVKQAEKGAASEGTIQAYLTAKIPLNGMRLKREDIVK